MPKKKRAKRKDPKRVAAGRKAARTRKRNLAAKRRRLPVWEVTFGYKGHTAGNSYKMVIRIRPRKKLREKDVIDLSAELIRSGHFDYQEPMDPDSDYTSDYQWTAFNHWDAIYVKAKQKIGTARLFGFYRD